VACEEGKFSDSYSQLATCTPCSPACAAGTRESQECTKQHDRVCIPVQCRECPAGSFTLGCDVAQNDPGVCQTCAECAPGQRRVGCGGLSQGSCEACPPGSFQGGRSAEPSCLPCSQFDCLEHEYIVSECSATADRVCGTCADAAAACDVGTYLEGCGNSSSGACVPCAPCDQPGHYRASCHALSPGTCTPCSSGFFHPGTGDPAACLPCTSACNGSSTSSYVAETCSASNDTTCAACSGLTCPMGFYRVGCGVADGEGECKRCAQCYAGSFISSECTPEANTICQPCAACNATYQELSPCSGTRTYDDKVCVLPSTTSPRPTTSISLSTTPLPVIQVVRVSLLLPIAPDEFDEAAQILLLGAVAAASGVDLSQVSIAGMSVVEVRRRLLAQAVKGGVGMPL